MMDRDTVLDLLAIVSASDHRTIGDADVVLWQQTIGHLSENDCADAIMAFRSEQPGAWLEPGHVLGRVRAKLRDRLDRADPDERASIIPLPPGARRDQFGAIDKSKNSAGEEDYPQEWTPQQRISAYWDKVRAHRENVEYEMGRSGSPRLLKQRPAGSDARAAIMAAFADKQFGADEGSGQPKVDPMQVACPFCKAKIQVACTVAGQVERLTSAPAHPSRLERAAQQDGYPESVVEEIVSSAQRRQARLVQAAWKELDEARPARRTQDADA